MQRRQLGPARFDWSEQFIFDLLLDRLQPTFGAASAALEVLDFAFGAVGCDPPRLGAALRAGAPWSWLVQHSVERERPRP